MTKYSIGIDIGGTNTRLGIVTQDGNCIDKKSMRTDDYEDVNLFVNDVSDLISSLKYNLAGDSEIAGIGIGAGAAIDSINRTIACCAGAADVAVGNRKGVLVIDVNQVFCSGSTAKVIDRVAGYGTDVIVLIIISIRRHICKTIKLDPIVTVGDGVSIKFIVGACSCC